MTLEIYDEVSQNFLLSAKNVSKSFGPIAAVRNVSINFLPGEVHCIVGENGAGKSTLVNLISGIYKKDAGEFFLDSQPYNPINIKAAYEKGVGIILQEPALISTFSVLENYYLGREDEEFIAGIFPRKEIIQKTKEELENLGLHVSTATKTRDLSLQDCKVIELARALAINPKLLIVDETSAALSHTYQKVLFKIIKILSGDGTTVLYITHHLSEVFILGDRVTVMKDGRIISTANTKDVNENKLRMLMVGRELSRTYYRRDTSEVIKNRKTVLSVKRLSTGILRDLSFELHEGTILGIGGITGQGPELIGRALFGDLKLENGTIEYLGEIIRPFSKDLVDKGIGFVPRNRDKEGLILTHSIKDNIILPNLDLIMRFGFILPKKENSLAQDFIKALSIKCQSSSDKCLNLSGGNRQKVVIAKWLARKCKILILDCPTRGIDVGTKAEIHNLMDMLRLEGVSILLITDELQELIGMSDSIIILQKGKVSGIWKRSDNPTENDLIKQML